MRHRSISYKLQLLTRSHERVPIPQREETLESSWQRDDPTRIRSRAPTPVSPDGRLLQRLRMFQRPIRSHWHEPISPP